jgi:hypothetical protein
MGIAAEVVYASLLRLLVLHASFIRDAVIYVSENAVCVTESHEQPVAFC